MYDEATCQDLTDSAALPLDICAIEIRVTEGGRRLLVERNWVVAGIERSSFQTALICPRTAVPMTALCLPMLSRGGRSSCYCLRPSPRLMRSV